MTPDPGGAGAAISRGVAYLWNTQATAVTEHGSSRAAFEGDWEQHVGFDWGPFRIPRRDTNPFFASGICNSLQHLSEENALTLGVSALDCDRAGEISARVLSLVERFETAEGTVAYWPEAICAPTGVFQRLQAEVFRSYYGGPALHGTLAPRGIRCFPEEFRVWPDPDCTAMASVARSVTRGRDCGTAPGSHDLREVLAPYAYTGKESLFFPSRGVAPRGAYFGFCVPPDRPELPRDVDLIVNCNILYALALGGAGESAEAGRIIEWILDTARTGAHHDIASVTLYYRWENVFHYAVARCYRDGGLSAVEPAVSRLSTELAPTAIRRRDGTVFWDGHSPIKATAFALLCLLAVGERGALVDGAARYLLAEQDSRTGAWRDRWAPLGETMTGRSFYFRSNASATALAIEALCRYQLDI